MGYITKSMYLLSYCIISVTVWCFVEWHEAVIAIGVGGGMFYLCYEQIDTTELLYLDKKK